MDNNAPLDVPQDFQHDVARAERAEARGDLMLLASEAAAFEWSAGGLRLVEDALGRVRGAAQPASLARVVLFAGHMIDTPKRQRDKTKVRFPPSAAAEATARRLIEDALRAQSGEEGGVSLGIASGACGSDILFHEVCFALGIETELFLALPREQFQATSVAHGGRDWIERYQALCDRVTTRVLAGSQALPRWLAGEPGYDIWQRNNFWMMFNALALEPRRLTLMALYNRDRVPDGPGGTGHLLEQARQRGFELVELDARKLLA